MKLSNILISFIIFGWCQFVIPTSFKCANFQETCYCNGNIFLWIQIQF